MIVGWWTRLREMWDKDENDVEVMSRHEKSGARHAILGWEDLIVG
jgi:hypothetical protein